MKHPAFVRQRGGLNQCDHHHQQHLEHQLRTKAPRAKTVRRAARRTRHVVCVLIHGLCCVHSKVLTTTDKNRRTTVVFIQLYLIVSFCSRGSLCCTWSPQPAHTIGDDDGTRAAKKACTEQHLGPRARRNCIRAYTSQKQGLLAVDVASGATTGNVRCPFPSENMSDATRQVMARCSACREQDLQEAPIG